MRVAIRVDASFEIGTGHFMRCLTLADALKQRGADIRFISRNLPEYLSAALASKGYEIRALDASSDNALIGALAHSHWLSTSQKADADSSLEALSDEEWDWLIVDHYALDSTWESTLYQAVKRILVIDDIADREHNCDVLLDQNLYADMNDRYREKVPARSRLLLGPIYALMRDEFRYLHEKTQPRSGVVNRALIFFGGMDVNNCTSFAMEALFSTGVPIMCVDVVIGLQHPFKQQILNQTAMYGYSCHVQTNKMADLMAAADVAIGAGGSATWERCCLGLPALVLSLADNQVDISKGLHKFGGCKYIGEHKMMTMPILQAAIADMLSQRGQLAAISKAAYSLVDGLGANRLCQTMDF